MTSTEQTPHDTTAEPEEAALFDEVEEAEEETEAFFLSTFAEAFFLLAPDVEALFFFSSVFCRHFAACSLYLSVSLTNTMLQLRHCSRERLSLWKHLVRPGPSSGWQCRSSQCWKRTSPLPNGSEQ